MKCHAAGDLPRRLRNDTPVARKSMRPVLPLVPLVCLLAFNVYVQEARAQRPPAAEPQPLPLLQGRPDAPADAGAGADSGGVALGQPFESQGLGIALRPPAGSKVVRKVGGTEVEFLHEQNKWSLKVSRMELAEPMELQPGVDPQKNLPRAGLLEVTVDRLKAAMPGATILRSDVINVGASDVGM